MRAMREKLKSERGATMLMALLLLLVAVMVSAVIVSAAVTATASLRTDRAQQQVYLTVSSAAELLRDSVLNGSGAYKVVVTRAYSDESMRKLLSRDETTVRADGPFSEILNNAVYWIRTYRTDFARKYTIWADGFDPVIAEVRVSYETPANGLPRYALAVQFSDDGTTEHGCRMQLTMTGTEETSTTAGWNGTQSYDVVDTTKIVWSDAGIRRKDET